MIQISPKALLDTNIIILHLSNKLSAPLSGNHFYLSVLTIFELLRYPGLPSNEEQAILSIMNACTILPVELSVARRAASLGRTHRTGAIDLLIAATALEYNLPLITKNTKDFRGITGMQVRQGI